MKNLDFMDSILPLRKYRVYLERVSLLDQVNKRVKQPSIARRFMASARDNGDRWMRRQIGSHQIGQTVSVNLFVESRLRN